MHNNQMILSSDIVSRTVKTQKLFNFDTGRCHYVNIQTSKKNQKNQDEPVIKIVNTVCKESGSHLSKTTEIRFKQKLIIIEDQYIFRSRSTNGEINGDRNSSQPTKSSDGSNHSNPLHQENHKSLMPMHKKKLIFKKKYLQDNARMEKRNTKNIAKNFCKAFINFLQDKKNSSSLNKAKQLMSYYNYNNKTIQALGKEPQTNQQFKQFLKQRASQWVESSKIYDKKIHKQAIPLYLSLVEKQNHNGLGYHKSHHARQIHENSYHNQNELDGGRKQYHQNGKSKLNNGQMMGEMRNQDGSSNSVYESDQLFGQQFEGNERNHTD